MKSELLDEAKRLGISDRLELVEAIWNLIAEDAQSSELPLSQAHAEELDRRLEDWRANPQDASPWDMVRERLKRNQ